MQAAGVNLTQSHGNTIVVSNDMIVDTYAGATPQGSGGLAHTPNTNTAFS